VPVIRPASRDEVLVGYPSLDPKEVL